MSESTNRGRGARSSGSKRSSRHAAAPPPSRPRPSPRIPTLAEGGLQLPPSSTSAPSEPKPEDPPEDPQPILYGSPEPLYETDFPVPLALPGAGESQRQEENLVSPPHTVRFEEQGPAPPLPSSSWQEENIPEVVPVTRSSVSGSVSRPLRPGLLGLEEPTYNIPPAISVANRPLRPGLLGLEEPTYNFPSSPTVTNRPLRPPRPGLLRLEEPTSSVPPSATATTRPLHPGSLGPEEPSFDVPPSTTVTIRVGQPSSSTPVRSSARHDEPIQTIPSMVRSNFSESAHTPIHLEVERPEEPAYSVHPATTITIRVDQPVPPSLNGRLPRHEEPIVSVPPPVGGGVSESGPRAPRRRSTSREAPNPNILPPTLRRPPRRGIAIHEGSIPNAPPLASRIVSEPLHRTSRRMPLRQERLTPIAPPLTTSGDRSFSFPGIYQPPSPPFVQRPQMLDVPNFASSPVPVSVDGESVPLASSRSQVPEVHLAPWVYQPPPPRSPDFPVPRASTSEVRPVAVPTFDRRAPDPISPELIIYRNVPPISPINGSLAPEKEASTLAERIPYIPPVASLLESFTTQNEVKQHQERWDVVDDKLGKVTRLVSDVVATCADNTLEVDDLPRGLPTIFQSLESQLGLIERARKQSENAGVIKRVFLGTYSQRKVKAYDAKLSNVLQSFQAALAFSPYFVQFAAQIEVEVTNVNVRYDEDHTPLHVASQLGHVQVMRSLIERGANTNAENEERETPLFLVSRNGNEEATKLLLRRSASVDHQDREKRTPLHGASENGHDSVTRLLLKSRANCNAKNVYKWTPLHLASRTGKSVVVRLLLRWRADMNAQNDFGWTPLHMAAQKGNREVAELLLSKNAVVDTPEARGDTALHLAAYYGHAAIVDLLINCNADVRMQNKERKTPLDLARREGHEDVVRLLEPRS